MSTSDAAAQLVNDVVTATSSLGPFPVLPFMQRLYNKARQTSSAATFSAQLPLETQYGPKDGLLINNIDETARLQKLATDCIVKAISQLDNNTDKPGFRACVQGAVADQATDSGILSLTSLLFAEHINWHLAEYKDAQGKAQPLPSLDQLPKSADFVNAFTKELTSDRFISGEVYQDMARGNHIFSMALLFIAQHLHNGPGFTTLSSSDFETSPACQVLTQWSSELIKMPQVDVKKVFSFITYVASGILVPNTTAAPLKVSVGNTGEELSRSARPGTSPSVSPAGGAFPVGALSRIVLDSVFQPAVMSVAKPAADTQSLLDTLTQGDIVEYQTIAQENQAQWNSMGGLWLTAISQAANAQSQYTRTDNNDFAHGFAEGLSLGIAGGMVRCIHHNRYWTDAVRGANPTLFTSNDPNTVHVDHQRTTPAGNRFTAGTKVATDKGEINIEKIAEGARILTEATAGRYGIASDEDVVSLPVGEKTLLVGFNKEGVFASPSHIFHTTTGQRAIEPELAMQENAFADVGRLRVGHALYRLSKDGKSYDVVPIESIQVQFVPATHLYGIHLREGDRSYHANGYHVALNYPEITIKSIARALSKLPRPQAIKTLQQIDELTPVFMKIGVPGVATLLRQEMKDARRRKPGPPLGHVKKMHHRRYQGLNFKDLKRTFKLEAKDSPLTDKNGPEGYKLPVLSVREGVLHLDHDIVPRVAFDTKGSTLRWSRTLEGGERHEHGVLNFTTHGLLGHGAVYISRDENPAELPEKLDAVIPFTAKKATSADVKSSVAESTKLLATSTGKPVDAATPAAAPISTVAFATTIPASPLADPGTIDHEDFYDVVVDGADWPANTNKTAPTSPASMGQVAMATYHSDGKGGLAVPVIVVPTLDRLLADINKTRAAASQLGSLYRSTVLVNKTGTLTGTVTFASASTVAQLSDQAPKTENDPLPNKNLTFSNLKSTVKIPILYQSAQFAFSWDFNDISGALYEFDPSTVGNTGQRHWFGTSSSPAPLPLTRAAFAVNSAEAKTTAHTRATSVAVPAGTHIGPAVAAVTVKPAPVTRTLAAAQPLTIQAIASIPGYSEDAVHKQSQTLLQNMMYYHMNESDRTTFLSYPKPTNLPISLADQLVAPLKTWIHDTYAPAYLSFMLSQVSAGDSKSWRVNFDDSEKNKIWYWWSGSGAKCLSKAPEYQQLNELTSRQAMIDLYGGTINSYLPDGQNWAKQLFKGWTGTHAMNALLQQPINDANVNLLNMYCNILHVLYPTTGAGGGVGEYADQLFQAVLSYAQSVQADSTATLNDPTGEVGRQWLYDAMNSLIIATLNNDPSLDSTVRNDLMNDLTGLQKELGIDAAQEASVKARMMLAGMNGLISNMAKWMTAISTGISKLWGLSGFSLAGTVFAHAAQASSQISPGKIALMKGCGILALTAVYAFAAVNSFMQWNTLSTTGRSQAVLITLKMVTDVAGRSFTAWAEYKKTPTTGASTPPPVADGEQLNQGLRAEISGVEGQKANIELSGANSGKPSPGVPDLIDDASSVAVTEGKVKPGDLSEAESFDEKVPAAPAEGSTETAWSRFNTPVNWLRAVGIAISVALVIVMSVSLAQNWNSLNDAGKALSVIQVITTGLAIAVDVAIFAGEMVAMETAMFLTVLPIVGAILAIIGLVVCVLMMVLGITKSQEPPPTPVETFIGNTAKPLISQWDPMPNPALSYKAVPNTVNAGATAPFTIIALNESGADVNRTSVQITLEGGSDPSCLFSNVSMANQGVRAGGLAAASALTDGQVAGLAAASALTDGQVAGLAVDAGPPAAALSEALTHTQRGDNIVSWDAVVQGVVDAATNPTGNLTLKGAGGVKQGFGVSFCGVVNKAGSCVVQVVEALTNGDSCRKLLPVTRR